MHYGSKMERSRQNCYIHPHEVLLENDLLVSMTGSGGVETPVTVTLTQAGVTELSYLRTRASKP